ncbi:hypothetical protein LAZ67_16002964 [Cordylochernes scorpioides]|uniref:Uncharacterized protein n=1 Tax=Cordylochernes scorpioides TaxID=51811 RepID=A0ABY6LCE6_9ARAC|nr:hypothetical protein LAZ67_16002964 [Cordylochernes scorpioides]
MAHVDGMSRAPVDDPRDTMEEIVEKNLEVCLTITLEEQILMIQHSDPELRDLIQIFRKDPSTEESPDEEPEVEDTPRRNPRRSCNARFNRGRLKSRNGRIESSAFSISFRSHQRKKDQLCLKGVVACGLTDEKKQLKVKIEICSLDPSTLDLCFVPGCTKTLKDVRLRPVANYVEMFVRMTVDVPRTMHLAQTSS